jgi:hypothetical protein
MKFLFAVFAFLLSLAPLSMRAHAQEGEAIDVAGTRVLLMRVKSPQASLILMPGGEGYIGVTTDGRLTRAKGNSLVRTSEDFRKRGLAVMIIEYNTDLRAAVDYMAAIKRPVIVAGTSRGTLRAAEGIAKGAKPDRLVLTSGFLTEESGHRSQNVAAILGSPEKLPPTLVVHHRRDGCRFTLPAGVDPFLKWAGGKARVTWLDGGESEGDACDAWAYHGFNEIESRMVAAVAGFR